MELSDAMCGLTWDGEDGEAIARAFRQSEAANRGILFMGMTGSGKTTAAMALTGIHGGLVIHCDNPEKVEALGWWRDWGMPDKSILLDELGRDAVRNNYGERRDVVGQFVREIYAAWKEGTWRGRLYATSNLDADGLRAAYDESVVGRLAELCVTCKFKHGRRVLANRAAPSNSPAPGAMQEKSSGNANPYAAAGIDMAGDAAMAACWYNATRKGRGAFNDALRILRVNLGVFDGVDCERWCALRRAGVSGKLSAFVGEAFLFGACADPEEAKRWARGVKAYIETVYAANAQAANCYDPDQAKVLDGWYKPFDFAAMVDEWREANAAMTATAGVFGKGGESERATA